ncbi:MAG: hypothetical protein IJC68_01245, partial [Firmicutes bacterium]|nr:hypothetical protein [Bacillota bacterium]
RTGVHDCRSFGLYWTTVGPDTEQKDFMEHVVFSDAKNEPEPEQEPQQDPQQGIAAEPEPKKGFPGVITAAIVAVLVLLLILAAGKVRGGRKGKRG